jgi:hypothetical protein
MGDSAEDARAIALDVAWAQYGRDVGNSEQFVNEILRSVGLLPDDNKFYTKTDLYNLFHSYQVATPYAGCLVFWRSVGWHKRTTQVQLLIDDNLYIGIPYDKSTVMVRTTARPPGVAGSAFLVYMDPFLKLEDEAQ